MNLSTFRPTLAGIIRTARRAGIANADIDAANDCAAEIAAAARNPAQWYENYCIAMAEILDKQAQRGASKLRSICLTLGE